MRRVWRVARWILLALILMYVALVIYRIPHAMQEDKDAKVIAQIQAQKITMDDVDGKHLPPPPDPNQVNATVAGVDVNGNGIRDDVELAIFDKYPGDANLKIRAAELQYAMTLQMYLIDVFDSNTWVAASQEQERGLACMLNAISGGKDYTNLHQWVSDRDWLKTSMFNTQARHQKIEEVGRYEISFGLLQGEDCDISSFN